MSLLTGGGGVTAVVPWRWPFGTRAADLDGLRARVVAIETEAEQAGANLPGTVDAYRPAVSGSVHLAGSPRRESCGGCPGSSTPPGSAPRGAT